MVMGIREYARHRGCALITVQRAIDQGRLVKTPDGKIDAEEADRAWSGHIDKNWQPGAPLLDAIEELGDVEMIEEQNPLPESAHAPRPPAPERISEQEARRRKEVALAELRQLEVAEKSGRVVDAQAVTDRWVAIASRVRDALLALPDKAAPVVAGTTGGDVNKVRFLLLTEVENLLRTLHDDLQPKN